MNDEEALHLFHVMARRPEIRIGAWLHRNMVERPRHTVYSLNTKAHDLNHKRKVLRAGKKRARTIKRNTIVALGEEQLLADALINGLRGNREEDV